MKSQSKIWNMIKDFNLIKYEITNGTIESHKFRLVLDFDGIIVKGKTMTINDLAKIVTEGFKRVDEKIDDVRQEMNTRFAEVDEKIDDVKYELKNEMNTKFDDIRVYIDNRFDKIEQRLDDHDAIFKRNNLE